MAHIHKEVRIKAAPAKVWDALRDVGALHTRLAPGFVTDVKMEEGARVVTFANGMTARERIVDIDDTQRRLCWNIVGGHFEHHNGVVQVFEDGEGTRFVWSADLLPHALAEGVTGMMEMGIQTIKRTLER